MFCATHHVVRSKSRRHLQVKQRLFSLKENTPSLGKAGQKPHLFSFQNMKGKLDKTVGIDCEIAKLVV